MAVLPQLIAVLAVLAAAAPAGASVYQLWPTNPDLDGTTDTAFGIGAGLWAHAYTDAGGGYLCLSPATNPDAAPAPGSKCLGGRQVPLPPFHLQFETPLYEPNKVLLGWYRLIGFNKNDPAHIASHNFQVVTGCGDFDNSQTYCADALTAFRLAAGKVQEQAHNMLKMRMLMFFAASGPAAVKFSTMYFLGGSSFGGAMVGATITFGAIAGIGALINGKNLNILQGSEMAQEAEDYFRDLSGFGQNQTRDAWGDPAVPAARLIAEPRAADYDTVAQPVFSSLPDPSNPTDDALFDSYDAQIAYGRAMQTALARYEAADAAGAEAAAAMQLRAVADFAEKIVPALQAAVETYDDLSADIVAAGLDVAVTDQQLDDFDAIKTRLASSGLTQAERDDLTGLGLSTEQIAAVRQDLQTEDVSDITAGMTPVTAAQQAAEDAQLALEGFREMARESTRTAAAIAPRLTIRQRTVPAEFGATAPKFAFTGGAGAFELVHGAEKTIHTSPGTYVATTSASPTGWRLQDITCSDGNSATSLAQRRATIVLDPADEVTCTFTQVANLAPEAADDAYTTGAGTTSIQMPLLENDEDPDGGALTITGHGTPSGGSVTCSTSTCTLLPPAGAGTTTFTYTISDGNGGTDTAGVSVTVLAGEAPPANQAPVVAGETLTTAEDTEVAFDLLDNDTDPDGDPLTLANVKSDPPATTSCGADGGCLLTPAPDYFGPITLTYTAWDGSEGTPGTAQITVTSVNDAPIATDDAVAIPNGYAATMSVLGNDRDTDGDTLSVALAAPPSGAHGTATCTSTTCTFTPAAGFTGATSFTYTASDGHGLSDTATVSVTVAASTAPVGVADVAPPRGRAPHTVSFDARGSYGTGLTYTWDFGDGTSATGAVVSHVYETAGTYDWRLTVANGAGQTAEVDGDDVTAVAQAASLLPICDDGTFNNACGDFRAEGDVQAYRIPGTGPRELTFVLRERFAAFAQELAMLEVDDAAGRLGTLLPGQPGWSRAALLRARTVFALGSSKGVPPAARTSLGGRHVAFVLIVGTTLDSMRLNDPDNATNAAFFTLDAANPDDVDHALTFAHKSGAYSQFGFEDLLGGGDQDFDDIVYEVSPGLSPVPGLTLTAVADKSQVRPLEANGYTLELTSSLPFPVTVARLRHVLPSGFAYMPQSTTGATTANPVGASGRRLVWQGPFVLEARGRLTLHFGARSAAKSGDYVSDASSDAGGFDSLDVTGGARVTVTDRPPVADDASASTPHATPVTVDLSASDPDGQALTLTVPARAPHGALVLDGTKLTYVPDDGFAGGDAFEFVASDGELSDTGTVTIGVGAKPDPPVTPVVVVPTVTATATPAATPAAPAAIATLPSTRRCVSRRKFTIRLRGPKGAQIVSAQVTLNGRKLKAITGKRLTAPVNLTGLPKGRVRVVVVLTAADGRRFRDDRRYRTCAPKRKKA